MGLEEPTAFQKQIAATLGIDISHDTRGVAAARIHTVVGPAILSKAAAYPASERQIDFARALGLNVSKDSSLVASAKIADELFVRNQAALEKLQLKPGETVRVRHRIELDGMTREWTEEFVISSIQPNCRIMFKGGNGRGAWPTQVEKVTD
ncbi:MAG: hypothetical protein C4570_07020 [Ammonifex sp.]|jgi:hypothetical protein|nr:MAG: hypothetical protein C4570_07020 [Ammonifex sp.]